MHHTIHITDKGRISLAAYETKQKAVENYVLDALNARALGTVVASIIAFEGGEGGEDEAIAAIKLKAKNLK